MNRLVRCLPSLSEREIPISSRLLLLFSLAVVAVGPRPWGRSDLAGQERRNRSADPEPGVLVQGEVVDHDTGDPVTGAAVSMASGPSGTQGRGTRVTGETGRFLFRDVPPGSYRLYVTNQGYRKMSDTLQVPAEGDLDLILPLSINPIRLEPIVVTAERVPPYRRGLEARRRTRAGFLVTREEIEERRPRYLTELLNRVPGGIVRSTPPHGYTLLLRGQCRPGIWLDGIKVPYVDSIDQLLSPHDVEAVEVFHGFELPVEFGVDACGGVLIWTRMGTPAPPGTDSESRGGILRRLATVAGLILLAFLLTR